MTPKAPLFSIIGGTLSGNRGAEAMTVTTIGQIRRIYPDARFVIYSYYPKTDAALLGNRPDVVVMDATPKAVVLDHFLFALLVGMLALIGLRWPKALMPPGARALRESRALLDVSGISFDDGRMLFLPYKILSIWPAMLMGVPVVKLSQAMGTFHKPLNRWSARFLLERCYRLYARGEKTGEFLTELGLSDAAWSLASDIAFLYQPDYSLTVENEPEVEALNTELAEVSGAGKRLVAIVPSSLVFSKFQKQGRDYVQLLLNLAETLVNQGFHVVFLPNATRGASNKPRNNDLYVLSLARKRAETLSAQTQQALHWGIWDMNTAAIRWLMAHADVVVASRFHGMIAALSLEIPVLVIGWSHKYQEVLAGFGLENYAVDFADAETNVGALVADLIERRPTMKTQLAEGLRQARASSQSQFEFLETLPV